MQRHEVLLAEEAGRAAHAWLSVHDLQVEGHSPGGDVMTKAELIDILEGAHDDTIILMDNHFRMRHVHADYATEVVDGKLCDVLVLTEGPPA